MTTQSNILVVEDDLPLREALCDTLELAGYGAEAVADGGSALNLLRHKNYDMVVSDIKMDKMDGHTLLRRIKKQYPELPVLLMTAYGSIKKAVDAMREGAVDYLVKPFDAEVLVTLVGQMVPEKKFEEGEFIAVDQRSLELLQLALRVAQSEATVMLNGESGVGKEVIAHYIHQHSQRAAKPFVAINCAAIPDNMLEATLFGYEKGAFTGAYKAHPGKFEQAQGGTLLLDEISEMKLGLQAKLLRVLQERELERLGGTEMIDLDVRILTTSNRDMRTAVAKGNFREDLFYRLNIFPLTIPPLRERKKDILPLAQRFLQRIANASARIVPILSDSAQHCLLEHRWRGNVRELDNVMQRALILQCGSTIDAKDIIFESLEHGQDAAINEVTTDLVADNSGMQRDIKAHEHIFILDALKKSMGNRKQVAQKLGISERTLRYKLARMRAAGMTVPDGRE